MAHTAATWRAPNGQSRRYPCIGLALTGWLAVGLTACTDGNETIGAGPDRTTGSAADTGPPTAASPTADSDSGAELPLVELRTTAGNIVLQLRPDAAPNTVANFIAYARSGYYDGSDDGGATIIHRIIPGFILQGGGLTLALQSKPTMPPVLNEAGLLGNDRGTLAMALTPGDPDSATSQFFINLTNNPELDAEPAYTVFASVVLGMEIVDAISTVPTTAMPPYADVPVDPIVIESVTIL